MPAEFISAEQIEKTGAPAGRHVLWGTEQAEQVMPVTSNFCFKGNTTRSNAAR